LKINLNNNNDNKEKIRIKEHCTINFREDKLCMY